MRVLLAQLESVQRQLPQDGEHIALAHVNTAQPVDDVVQYLAQVPERLPVALIDSVSGGTP